MNKIIRTTLGFLVAPLAIPCMIALFILWDSFQHWGGTQWSFTEYYSLPLVILFWYLLYAYISELILFLPIFFLLNRHSLTKMKYYSTSGIGIGAITGVILTIFRPIKTAIITEGFIFYILIGIISGLCIGMIFWSIVIRLPKMKKI
ncbi:MAG: hypothetical protein KAI91_06910 [Candidatus Omnitrophica bacterium]|nr:hypothetical protein [Candidatus Omnitrophota bacterium]